MRLPFALDLKVGTDICDVRRIREFVCGSERRRDGFMAKLLSAGEMSGLGDRYLRARRFNIQPADDVLRVLARRLAGRFAAKEAAKKAWGASLISWHDLYTEFRPDLLTIICKSGIDQNDPNREGGPGLVTEQAGVLSISHDGDYAVATVLAAPLHSDILVELRRRKAEAEAKVTAVGGNRTTTNKSVRSVYPGPPDGSTKPTTPAVGDELPKTT